jgi:hypothetical protein
VSAQKDAATRSSKSTSLVSKNLFDENTANMAPSKTYITQQQLMNRTRSNKRRKVTTLTRCQLIGI